MNNDVECLYKCVFEYLAPDQRDVNLSSFATFQVQSKEPTSRRYQ